MDEIVVPDDKEAQEGAAIPKPVIVSTKLGSVEIEIREVKLSRPARAVNRIWPNR